MRMTFSFWKTLALCSLFCPGPPPNFCYGEGSSRILQNLCYRAPVCTYSSYVLTYLLHISCVCEGHTKADGSTPGHIIRLRADSIPLLPQCCAHAPPLARLLVGGASSPRIADARSIPSAFAALTVGAVWGLITHANRFLRSLDVFF